MSGMAGKGTGVPGRESLTNDEQIVQVEVEQMGLAPLSQQSSQQPTIEFAMVEDSDSDGENDDADGNNYGQYTFFDGFVSSSPDIRVDMASDDEWSDYSSDSDNELDPFSIYGAYFCLVTGMFKPFYRFVKPNPRTSCNAAAAALKEPISLLTKYRSQRLGGQSKYFREAYPAPSKALRLARQVRRGSRLKKVQNVDDQKIRRA